MPGNTPKHAIHAIEAFSRGRQAEFQETPAEGQAIENWQLLPPIVTSKLAAVEKAPPTLVPTSQEPLPSVPLPAPVSGPAAVERNQASAPYDWRTPSPQGPLPLRRADSTGWNAGPTELRPASHQRARLPAKRQTRGNDRISRRRVIALLAGAGVTTAGTVIVADAARDKWRCFYYQDATDHAGWKHGNNDRLHKSSKEYGHGFCESG